jgi:methylated-DNA-[protein]-cysteine S-methyltransferase
MPQLSIHSPIGDLSVSEQAGEIVSLDWGWGAIQNQTPLLLRAKEQLDEYFDRKRTKFTLPLDPPGTEFQCRVWEKMIRIPYGRTISYGDLAADLGTSSRPVGQACARNPIPIIIPCHRVVAQSGRLGGYSGDGGRQTKRALLNLEATL